MMNHELSAENRYERKSLGHLAHQARRLAGKSFIPEHYRNAMISALCEQHRREVNEWREFIAGEARASGAE